MNALPRNDDSRPVRRADEPSSGSAGLRTWLLGALLLALVVIRTTRAVATDAALDHVSGTWLALADDLLRGELYRPLAGTEGMGGTRFFPLVFSLLAGLRPLVGNPFTAGHALSVVSGGLLAGAAWMWMSRLGVARPIRLLSLGILLSTASAGQALGAIRGDVLPAALGVFGAALALPRRRNDGTAHLSHGSTAASALCLALAVCGKPTAVAWVVVAALGLALSGRRRAAALLAPAVGLASGALLVTVDILSDGRFSASLAAGATGGARLIDWLKAPSAFLGVLGDRDPLSLAFLAPALIAAGLKTGPDRRSPARIAVAVWLAATLILFGSPGVDYNHLLDLQVAAVVLLAVVGNDAGATGLGRTLLPGLALLSVAWVALHPIDGLAGRGATRDVAALRAEVVRFLPPAETAPILSEDPAIPIAAGERAWLLDAFMARLVRTRDPGAAEPLWTRLRDRGFRAVVLVDSPAATDWYNTTHFGPGFARTIEESWFLARTVGHYRLFLPRASPPRE